MNISEKGARINDYMMNMLSFMELNKAEQKVDPGFEEDQVYLEWDSVDHIFGDPLELYVTYEDEEARVDVTFKDPDTVAIMFRLGDAFWEAGLPTDRDEIARVLKEVEHSWSEEMSGPIQSGMRPDVGLKVRCKEIGPVQPPTDGLTLNQFVVELRSGRLYKFDFREQTMTRVESEEHGALLEFRLEHLDMRYVNGVPTRRPESWTQVFDGILRSIGFFRDDLGIGIPQYDLVSVELYDLSTGKTALTFPVFMIDAYNNAVGRERRALRL